MHLQKTVSPHLQALENRGLWVERLHSEAFGISLSGRASMLSGQPAAVNGVYNNRIWDTAEQRFRYAHPDDIRTPTVPALAKAAGKKVACLGAGMIRAEDVNLMVAPYWVDGWSVSVQKARDEGPQPAEASWMRAVDAEPTADFIEICADHGLPHTYPAQIEGQRQLWELMCDHLIADWVGLTAAHGDYDLIWAEFCLPDAIFHAAGMQSDPGQWIAAEADMAVGKIVERLSAAGKLDEWHIAVMGDHGFGMLETSLYFSNICPGVTHENAGNCIIVLTDDADELATVSAKLAEHDVDLIPSGDIFPAEWQGRLHLFSAPDGVSWGSPPEGDTTSTSGPVGYPATHGFRPGNPLDDRMCIFAGPVISPSHVPAAAATQVAPTVATLVGLPADHFAGESLI